MVRIKKVIKRFLNRYVYQDWNIAIADVSDDLTPVNIKWMKHDYHDRWFADPFIIGETADAYIILAEECMHVTMRGRLARLTVSKSDCRLLNNETILDLPTHLSFPNYIKIDSEIYIYPENAGAGNTRFYRYGNGLTLEGILSNMPLADATIVDLGGEYYLLATMGQGCNGNTLKVYKSSESLGGYSEFQDVIFADNIARRAGNAFMWGNELISPAQICNNDYGEGVSLQKVTVSDGQLMFSEIKRMYPPTKDYPEGFHTYNLFGDNTVAIDGYRYGSKMLHNLYFRFRK